MTDTYSEQHRHRCEVRECIRRGFAWLRWYVDGMEKARASRLWRDVKAQAAAGNTGSAGEWVDTAETSR